MRTIANTFLILVSLCQLDQFVFPAAKAKLCCSFNCMDTVSGFHTLKEVRLTRVVLCGIDQIQAGLIDSNGIQRGENADILHAGVFRNRAAVTVYGKILHDVYKSNPAFKMPHHGRSGVCHSFAEAILLSVLWPGFDIAV